MANTNATIDHNSTGTSLSVGEVTLNYEDTLTIAVGTGFPNPTATQITQVAFFNVVNHEKGGTSLGAWNRVGSSNVPSGVSVATDGSGVVLTNDDDGSVDDDYYYQVTATDTTTRVTYTADPELILRKKTTTQSAQAAKRRPPSAEA